MSILIKGVTNSNIDKIIWKDNLNNNINIDQILWKDSSGVTHNIWEYFKAIFTRLTDPIMPSYLDDTYSSPCFDINGAGTKLALGFVEHDTEYATAIRGYSISGTSVSGQALEPIDDSMFIYDVKFNPNGSYLIALTYNSIVTYSVGTSSYTNKKTNVINAIETGTNTHSMTFNDAGTKLVVTLDQSPYIKIYSVSGSTYTQIPNPTVLPSSPDFRSFTMCCGFNPNGDILIVGEKDLIVYTVSGNTFASIPHVLNYGDTISPQSYRFVKFSPDGTKLAIGGTRGFKVFSVEQTVDGPVFTKIHSFYTANIDHKDACFNNTGELLAVTDSSQCIRIYKVSNTSVKELNVGVSDANYRGYDVKFSPAGDLLFYIQENKSNGIWKLAEHSVSIL